MPLSPTPACARRAVASDELSPSAATSSWTKFVSTAASVDGQPALGPARGERARPCVVVGEPRHVVVERVQRRRRRRRRPGASRRRSGAWRPAPAPSARPAAGDQRAERAAEPFGEAERDRVEEALRSRRPRRRRRRPRSRCVRRRGARRARARVRPRRCRRSSSSGQTAPPALLCVFSSASSARPRPVERVGRPDRGAQLIGGEAAAPPGAPASAGRSARRPRRARRS